MEPVCHCLPADQLALVQVVKNGVRQPRCLFEFRFKTDNQPGFGEETPTVSIPVKVEHHEALDIIASLSPIPRRDIGKREQQKHVHFGHGEHGAAPLPHRKSLDFVRKSGHRTKMEVQRHEMHAILGNLIYRTCSHWQCEETIHPPPLSPTAAARSDRGNWGRCATA